uniref:Uncharacterized protein n=1 Tax=Arundo donax TaxID=35708 RepID=A0A0A9C6L6_ARUDO
MLLIMRFLNPSPPPDPTFAFFLFSQSRILISTLA